MTERDKICNSTLKPKAHSFTYIYVYISIYFYNKIYLLMTYTHLHIYIHVRMPEYLLQMTSQKGHTMRTQKSESIKIHLIKNNNN